MTTAAGTDDSMIGRADNWPAGGRHVASSISYSGLLCVRHCLADNYVDNNTCSHYVTVCDPSCDKGLMRCSGLGASDCCNFYNASTCVDECPSHLLPNNDNDCACPVGTTGYNCSEGESGTLHLHVHNNYYVPTVYFLSFQLLTVVH